MQGLTKQHIKAITEAIDCADITFSHLREDLIDHLCCEIEARLEAGSDFNRAFDAMKVNFGIKSLQQVQEKTLLLIDKNYCTMKTTMKISGIAATILLLTGSLFKIYHWPWASLLITLGFLVMCFLFLPSVNYTMLREGRDKRLILLFLSAFLGSSGFFLGILFKIQHWYGSGILLAAGTGILCLLFFPFLLRFLFRKAASKREKAIYTVGVLSGMLFFLGMLFKLMHWPGAGIFLMVLVLCMVFLFLPFYSWHQYARKESVEPGFIYIIAGISWFCMFGMLISMSGSVRISQIFYDTQQTVQHHISLLDKKNESVYAMPVNESIAGNLRKARSVADELDQYINDLKAEIIRTMDQQNQTALSEGNIIDITKIVGTTNTKEPFMVMLGETGNGKASVLKDKIIRAREGFLNLVNKDQDLTQLMVSCLNTDLPENAPEGIQSWELFWFDNTTAVGCMDVLTCFQRNVRIAEYEVIQYLVRQ